VLVITGLALLWLSLANTVPLVLGRARPTLATGLGLGSAKAQSALAMSLVLNQPSADDILRARQLAQAALRREPVNVQAVVALSTIAFLRNQPAVGRRLFTYSERLSRHDPTTQLWLIEDHVERGDVQGALVHYDRLMRVSPSFRPTLIPILVNASADPAIVRPLATLLARRPNWWREATASLIFQTPAPATTLPILLRVLQLRHSIDFERALISGAMTRLASVGEFKQASALYLASGGTRLSGRELVRNGGFEDPNRLPPFEWELSNTDGRAAVVQSRSEGDGKALFLYVDQDSQGELAKQFLLLPPGRYRLQAQSGDIVGDQFQRPQISIRCATSDARLIVDLRLPASSDAGQGSRAEFTVGAGCPAQWISLTSGTGAEVQDSEPWVDSVSIQPVA
jgi:hypothetical protein